MEDNDDRPRAKRVQPIDLGPLSVEELRDYIAALEGEIERAKANIAGKERHRAGAESIFRK